MTKRGPPRKPGAISHQTRPAFDPRYPIHVTMRLTADAPSLTRSSLMTSVIRPSIEIGQRPFFHIVAYNVEPTQMHLICEAEDVRSLSYSMQSMTIRIARRVNSLVARRGRLFEGRYLAVPLRTVEEIASALRTVLGEPDTDGDAGVAGVVEIIGGLDRAAVEQRLLRRLR